MLISVRCSWLKAIISIFILVIDLSFLVCAQNWTKVDFNNDQDYKYFKGIRPNDAEKCIESQEASPLIQSRINATAFSECGGRETRRVRFNWTILGYFRNFFKLKFRIDDKPPQECDRDPFDVIIEDNKPNYTLEWILEHDGRPHIGENLPTAYAQIDDIELLGLQFENETPAPGEEEVVFEQLKADPKEGSIFDSYSLIAQTKNIKPGSRICLWILDSQAGGWEEKNNTWSDGSNIIKFDKIYFNSWGEKRWKISCKSVYSPDATIQIYPIWFIPDSGSNLTSYKCTISSKNISRNELILEIKDYDDSQWKQFKPSSSSADNITFDLPDLSFIKTLTLGAYLKCRFKIGQRVTDEFDGPQINSLIYIHQDGVTPIVNAIFDSCGQPLCLSYNNHTNKKRYSNCGDWQEFRFDEIDLSQSPEIGPDDLKLSDCND